MTFRQFISQVRFVNKRSSRTTIIAVGIAIVLSVACLLVMHALQLDAEAEKEAWRQEAIKQEQEQNKLEDKLNNLGSQEGVEDIAKDELGLVDPDTIVVQPEN